MFMNEMKRGYCEISFIIQQKIKLIQKVMKSMIITRMGIILHAHSHSSQAADHWTGIPTLRIL